MDSLLSVNDPDWAAFKAGDDAYLLKAAGEEIRRFCGWHIFPSITEEVEKLPVGSNGLIELPSLYVTDVLSVSFSGSRGDIDVKPADYVWQEYGMVKVRRPHTTVPWGFYGGYGFVPGGYLPGTSQDYAKVVMTHGFSEVPAAIKQVVFELVSAVAEMPAGNVREVQTPGFKLALSQAAGMTLNKDQRDRLGSFRLGYAR